EGLGAGREGAGERERKRSPRRRRERQPQRSPEEREQPEGRRENDELIKTRDVTLARLPPDVRGLATGRGPCHEVEGNGENRLHEGVAVRRQPLLFHAGRQRLKTGLAVAADVSLVRERDRRAADREAQYDEEA